jgi:hypothetical protein
MEHPPGSPDMALNDYWLFQKIKSALKGQRFQDIEYIQKNLMMALRAILWQEFQRCFQWWQHHWAECIAVQGEYFKGEHSQ